MGAVKKARAATGARRIHHGATLDALVEAYQVARRDALGRDDPIARDAAKILEALIVAVGDGDVGALRAGTAWARKLAPGGRGPMSDLVRDLYRIALEGGGPGAVAQDAAIKLIVSGLLNVGPDAGALATRIEKRLAVAAERGARDAELQVKEILRVAMTEKQAGNALTAARALLHTVERLPLPPTVPATTRRYTRRRM
jgi:hypothetical protein